MVFVVIKRPINIEENDFEGIVHVWNYTLAIALSGNGIL